MVMIPPCTFLHSGSTQLTQGSLKKPNFWSLSNFWLGQSKLSVVQFLYLSTRHNLPNNYSLFFNDTQLSPSPTLNILGLSFTCNLSWKLHISSLAKTASVKLGVLSHLCQFYSPPQLLTLYRGLICPCMGYALLNRVESKAFRLINSSPLTDCLKPLSPR